MNLSISHQTAAADDHDRSVRSHYYEKVGIRGVEEKKSLEILLKDDPVDLEKLATFCLRYPLPLVYREHAWNLLLDIVPVYKETQQYVMSQRDEQYYDAWNAVKVLKRVDSQTPLPNLHLKMFILQSGSMRLGDCQESELDKEMCAAFISISQALLDVTPSRVLNYWISARLFNKINGKSENVLHLASWFGVWLQKEDSGLYNHLVKTNCLKKLDFTPWFRSGMAGVLQDSSVVRIWDRLIAGSGSIKVLVGVAVAMVISTRMKLMQMTTAAEMMKLLEHVSDDIADVITGKGIELWKKYCNHT